MKAPASPAEQGPRPDAEKPAARRLPSKGGVLLAILVGALVAFFGPELAGASQLETQRAEPGGSGWWTAERMRGAEDVDPPPADPTIDPPAVASASAASPGAPLTIPSAEPTETRALRSQPVGDATAPGVRTHGRVFFKIPGVGTASCSGTAINSNRRNLLLTAGHCVHRGGHPGGWFKKLVFVPAYRDGEAPYGIWKADRLYTTGIFAEFGDPTGDIGMAGLRRSRGSRLQDAVGARGVAFGRDRKQNYKAYGYPAAGSFDGQRERLCRSRLLGSDDSTKRFLGPRTMGIECDMTEGASGGGWVIGNRLTVSLSSYGYRELPDVVFGPYFGSLAKDLYKAAVATCRGEIATMVGSGKGERLRGTAKRDVIVAGAGADRVKGRGGNDVICGGAGPDRLDGGAGNDELVGQKGGDRLDGGSGKDLCKGGGGRNRASSCERKRAIP